MSNQELESCLGSQSKAAKLVAARRRVEARTAASRVSPHATEAMVAFLAGKGIETTSNLCFSQNLDPLLEFIRQNDREAIEVGVELLHQDEGFPFGMICKTQVARRLMRVELTPAQVARLRSRFTEMILRGYLPPEFQSYARLFRRIGVTDEQRRQIAQNYNPTHGSVARWVWYLLQDHQQAGKQGGGSPWYDVDLRQLAPGDSIWNT